MNTSKYFSLNTINVDLFKQKVLCWLKQYNTFTYLDNNHYENAPNRYELLVGVDSLHTFTVDEIDMPSNKGQWMFGHLSYDYKNFLYSKLKSTREQHIAFPYTHFYIPQIIVAVSFKSQLVEIHCKDNHQEIFEQILHTNHHLLAHKNIELCSEWYEDFNRDTYLDAVKSIQNHIKEGDCYELNLCNGSGADIAYCDPFALFHTLNTSNPSPFAAFYRLEEQFVLCSSPERYLYKEKSTLISQPIKGTIKKGATPEDDEQLKIQLKNSIKEQAENLMITDLVRNDLARMCEVGSVIVPDLLGLYSFNSLHHLITTISGKVQQDFSLKEILTYPFPMGSMTGAPKYIVMELIDAYEKSSRGIYSGTIAYINPEGDFDSNVVIRSLVYDSRKQYLSYHSGGAITIDSDPIQEWEEICLKSQRLKDVLSR